MSMRYGKTEQEARLQQAFAHMRLRYHKDRVVCFMCGRHFQNYTPTSYPHSCYHCSAVYDKALMYCMPDLLVLNGDKAAVVFVNGSIHDKAKVRKKDLRQIETLAIFGYRVFVIMNDLIDNCQTAWLRALAYTTWHATADEQLYRQMHEGEKELVGFGSGSGRK